MLVTAVPDVLSQATPENWSLGSLQYLLTAGLGLPKRINASTINATLIAEEVMRHRSEPFMTALARVFGSRFGLSFFWLILVSLSLLLPLRFPSSGSVACSVDTEWFICAPMASITAYLGNRNESQV